MFSKSERGTNRLSEVPGSAKDAPPSLINGDLQVAGNLRSQSEVRVDGNVDGDVFAHSLTIGEKGTINGEIVADDVVVGGRVNGRIRARKVQLGKSAHVIGDIWYELLEVDSGALVEGHCKRTDKPNEISEPRIESAPMPHREVTSGPALA